MNCVDVIIPVFNGATYISDAVNSVFAQTFRDTRVFVVDDGSTDDTRRRLSAYRGRINYIYQHNRGPAAARNRGIRAGEGEYIAFLDADDIWLDEKLEKQLRALEMNKKAEFVYCDNYFVDAGREPIENYCFQPLMKRGDILEELFCRYFIITSSLVVRRACLQKTGLFDETLKVGEDYEFFLRLARFFEAEVVEEKLWERRVLENSLSRRDFVLDARTDLITLKRFIQKYPDFLPGRTALVSKRFASYYFDLAYQCRHKGRNLLALKNSALSLSCAFSTKALKNLLFSFVPYFLFRKMRSFLPPEPLKQCLK